eukprot:1139335-Pelagomonas_calceolata.AAC.4
MSEQQFHQHRHNNMSHNRDSISLGRGAGSTSSHAPGHTLFCSAWHWPLLICSSILARIGYR